MLVSIFFLFLTIGCGQSPLLNHTHASSNKAYATPVLNYSCPLKLAKVNLCMALDWVTGPKVGEADEFTLKFWSATDGNAEGPYVIVPYDVRVTLRMPQMGHSSVGKVTPLGDRFDVTQVYFTMDMLWNAIIDLAQGSEIIDEVVYEIKF